MKRWEKWMAFTKGRSFTFRC